MARMSPFYTQTGDEGRTGLLGEGRVPKFDLQIEALGALDEATAALGLARASANAPLVTSLLLEVQRDLYKVMAEVSATPENAEKFRSIDASRVQWLETQTDAITAEVEIPREFILPGENPSSAAMALARKRLSFKLLKQAMETTGKLSSFVVFILVGSTVFGLVFRGVNGDLCFVLELLENQHNGQTTRLAKSK